MKFSTSKSELLIALQKLSKAIPTRSTLTCIKQGNTSHIHRV